MYRNSSFEISRHLPIKGKIYMTIIKKKYLISIHDKRYNLIFQLHADFIIEKKKIGFCFVDNYCLVRTNILIFMLLRIC